MPQIVSENHAKFVEKFFATGKYKMINNRNQSFIKLKNGLIKPILSFLNIDTLNFGNMILIVSENGEFGKQEEEDENKMHGLIIANEKL